MARFLGPALCGGRAAGPLRGRLARLRGSLVDAIRAPRPFNRRSSVIAVVSSRSRLQGSFEFLLRLEFRGPAGGVLNSRRLARGGR